jgi:hypothetical protein
MPIETELTGEQAVEITNRIGISRMVFDNQSCFCFLKDGSAIEFTIDLDLSLSKHEFRFFHKVFLPLDNKPVMP